MRKVAITPETPDVLRELFRRAHEAHDSYQNALAEARNRCNELAAPVDSTEIAALCRDTNEIEVVKKAEYLRQRNNGRWY